MQVCAAFQNSGILPLIFLNAMFRGRPELLTRGVAYVRCVAPGSSDFVRFGWLLSVVAVACAMPMRCCGWNAGVRLVVCCCRSAAVYLWLLVTERRDRFLRLVAQQGKYDAVALASVTVASRLIAPALIFGSLQRHVRRLFRTWLGLAPNPTS